MWNLFIQWQEKIDCKFLLSKLSHSLKLTKISKKATRNFLFKISFTHKNSRLTTFVPELIVGLRHLGFLFFCFFSDSSIKKILDKLIPACQSSTSFEDSNNLYKNTVSYKRNSKGLLWVKVLFTKLFFPMPLEPYVQSIKISMYRFRDSLHRIFSLQDMFPFKNENTWFQKTA